jgi:hypothetical protein
LGRINEIIWLQSKPRNPNDAKITIKHYLNVVVEENNFYSCTRYCLAQASILLRIFRDESLRHALRDKVENLVKQSEHDLALHRSYLDFNHKLQILKNDIDSVHCCVELSERCLEEKKFDTARQYIELALDICKTLREQEHQPQLLELKGDAWALEAESRANDSALVANQFWTNAINVYRKIQGLNSNLRLQDKIRNIEHTKQDLGSRILGEMKTVSFSYDATETVEQVVEFISGKERPQEAISALCALPNALDKQKVMEDAESMASRHSLLDFFSSVHVARDGRTVGHSPSSATLEPSTDDNLYMLSSAKDVISETMSFYAQAIIVPAIDTIIKEHHIHEDLMQQLCGEASIIDFDRKDITSKALLAGFNRNFDIAVHMLVPQIEHIVRSSLKENNHLVHTTQGNGTENVSVLSFLLSEQSAKEVFDEQFLFELNILFSNESIFNIRNQLAHGLMNDDDSLSTISVYIWWRFLKLAISSTSLVDN